MPSPLERMRKLNQQDCLWTYILRILSRKRMHAYAVRRAIQEEFGFTPGTVTAYKVLYLLQKGGFVSQSPAGRKKVYSLTPPGRAALRAASSFYASLAKKLR